MYGIPLGNKEIIILFFIIIFYLLLVKLFKKIRKCKANNSKKL